MRKFGTPYIVLLDVAIVRMPVNTLMTYIHLSTCHVSLQIIKVVPNLEMAALQGFRSTLYV